MFVGGKKMEKELAQNLFQNTTSKYIGYVVGYRKLTGSVVGAIVLSQLMYWASKKLKFWKTDEELMEETGITRNELMRAKRQLKRLSFLKVTLEGIPSKTWYEVDPKAWMQTMEKDLGNAKDSPKVPDIQEAGTFTDMGNNQATPKVTGKQEPRLLESSNLSSVLKLSSKTTSVQDKLGQQETTPTIHGKWIKYAMMLSKAIGVHRKEKTAQRIPAWAREIRKLQTVEGVKPHHIREVMEWYCEELSKQDLIKANPNFLPVAYSGDAFRNKFLKLEAAMNRRRPTPEKPKEYPPWVKKVKVEFLQQLRNEGVITRPMGVENLLIKVNQRSKEVRLACESIVEKESHLSPLQRRETFFANLFLERRHTFGEMYQSWMIRQIVSWESWGGDMSSFAPGGKNWLRYLGFLRQEWQTDFGPLEGKLREA